MITENMMNSEERIEDILTLYAAGVMSYMDGDSAKGGGWIQRAEVAALQMGAEAFQSSGIMFGVSELDKAYARGRAERAQGQKSPASVRNTERSCVF